ncbi:MAG: geranylgeranylglyceryl/heptaprenylglyceryl phosphate synthase, partial [Fidelibacterota bacterium]
MNIFRKLEAIRQEKGAVAFALVDPDQKNEGMLTDITSGIVQAGFDAILVGGSLIMDNGFEDRINEIREISSLPIIIFPGSSRQLSGKADAVLFLSLHSGRNPQYLIGEQVQSAPVLKNLNIESIPTSYLLIDGGV